MFKKIIGTIGTRALTAVLAFITWTLNAQYLGPENVGTISLIIFSVAIIQLFTNFIAGAALIYLTPRTGIYKLFIPAYIWSLTVTLLAAGGLQVLGTMFPILEIIPAGYFLPVMFLALVMSLTTANYMLLLGLERVKSYNIISLVQIVILFLILLLMLFGVRLLDVMAYYWAIFISYLIAMVFGLFVLIPSLKKVPLTNMKALLLEILRFGSYVQFANIFQTMNYRLSLKFVDYFIGRGAVGVLALGMQLAEGMWLISRSIATVQYSRLSNEMNYDYSVRLTLTLAKISWVVTGFAMLIVLAIPNSVFITIFTAGFEDVKMVIASLALGIVALSVSMIFSGFFSSINKPYHNTVSSATGLIFTIGLGLWLIPAYGIMGAGISATVSYSFVTLYQFIVFSSMTKLTARDFLLTRKEISLLYREIKKAVTHNT
ncbi:MAG: polysaccharide biosynthesis C-terminal domain-containing protein [Bacteroidales bacterium]|nr:polysaccharide biosynthesis C-terminal domain-containing protein [Bacteroidales bacterium]